MFVIALPVRLIPVLLCVALVALFLEGLQFLLRVFFPLFVGLLVLLPLFQLSAGLDKLQSRSRRELQHRPGDDTNAEPNYQGTPEAWREHIVDHVLLALLLECECGTRTPDASYCGER